MRAKMRPGGRWSGSTGNDDWALTELNQLEALLITPPQTPAASTHSEFGSGEDQATASRQDSRKLRRPSLEALQGSFNQRKQSLEKHIAELETDTTVDTTAGVTTGSSNSHVLNDKLDSLYSRAVAAMEGTPGANGASSRQGEPIRKLKAGDRELEVELRLWLAALGHSVPGNVPLIAALRSGVVLCELANTLSPGSIGSISHKPSNFLQMENINKFLSCARSLGVRNELSFQTVDLFENKSPSQVLRCLADLKRMTSVRAAEVMGELGTSMEHLEVEAETQTELVDTVGDTLRPASAEKSKCADCQQIDSTPSADHNVNAKVSIEVVKPVNMTQTALAVKFDTGESTSKMAADEYSKTDSTYVVELETSATKMETPLEDSLFEAQNLAENAQKAAVDEYETALEQLKDKHEREIAESHRRQLEAEEHAATLEQQLETIKHEKHMSFIGHNKVDEQNAAYQEHTEEPAKSEQHLQSEWNSESSVDKLSHHLIFDRNSSGEENEDNIAQEVLGAALQQARLTLSSIVCTASQQGTEDMARVAVEFAHSTAMAAQASRREATAAIIEAAAVQANANVDILAVEERSLAIETSATKMETPLEDSLFEAQNLAENAQKAAVDEYETALEQLKDKHEREIAESHRRQLEAEEHAATLEQQLETIKHEKHMSFIGHKIECEGDNDEFDVDHEKIRAVAAEVLAHPAISNDSRTSGKNNKINHGKRTRAAKLSPAQGVKAKHGRTPTKPRAPRLGVTRRHAFAEEAVRQRALERANEARQAAKNNPVPTVLSEKTCGQWLPPRKAKLSQAQRGNLTPADRQRVQRRMQQAEVAVTSRFGTTSDAQKQKPREDLQATKADSSEERPLRSPAKLRTDAKYGYALLKPLRADFDEERDRRRQERALHEKRFQIQQNRRERAKHQEEQEKIETKLRLERFRKNSKLPAAKLRKRVDRLHTKQLKAKDTSLNGSLHYTSQMESALAAAKFAEGPITEPNTRLLPWETPVQTNEENDSTMKNTPKIKTSHDSRRSWRRAQEAATRTEAKPTKKSKAAAFARQQEHLRAKAAAEEAAASGRNDVGWNNAFQVRPTCTPASRIRERNSGVMQRWHREAADVKDELRKRKSTREVPTVESRVPDKVPEPILPPGWEVYTSTRTKRNYFYQPSTGVSQYQFPGPSETQEEDRRYSCLALEELQAVAAVELSHMEQLVTELAEVEVNMLARAGGASHVIEDLYDRAAKIGNSIGLSQISGNRGKLQNSASVPTSSPILHEYWLHGQLDSNQLGKLDSWMHDCIPSTSAVLPSSSPAGTTANLFQQLSAEAEALLGSDPDAIATLEQVRKCSPRSENAAQDFSTLRTELIELQQEAAALATPSHLQKNDVETYNVSRDLSTSFDEDEIARGGQSEMHSLHPSEFLLGQEQSKENNSPTLDNTPEDSTGFDLRVSQYLDSIRREAQEEMRAENETMALNLYSKSARTTTSHSLEAIDSTKALGLQADLMALRQLAASARAGMS